MFKLAKYEFKKNILVPAILLIVIVFFEMLFLTGILLDKTGYVALGFGLQMLVTLFAFFIILASSISSYSRELKSKSSYMTFMTPISTYSVIGSKLLVSFFVGIFFAILLFILVPINFAIIKSTYSEFRSFVDGFNMFMDFFGYNLAGIILNIITVCIKIMISYYLVVVLSYLSITLSSTVLQNKKLKGFLSAVIFAVLYGFAMFVAFKMPEIIEPTTLAEAFVASLPVMLFNILCIVLAFFATGRLLEKRVSL